MVRSLDRNDLPLGADNHEMPLDSSKFASLDVKPWGLVGYCYNIYLKRHLVRFICSYEGGGIIRGSLVEFCFVDGKSPEVKPVLEIKHNGTSHYISIEFVDATLKRLGLPDFPRNREMLDILLAEHRKSLSSVP